MKFTCGLNCMLPLLMVLLLVVATKGHTELECYVCDDCEKVDKKTPVEHCGGENFIMTTTTSTPMSPTSVPTTKSSDENVSPTTLRSTPSDSTTMASTTTINSTLELTTTPSSINSPPSIVVISTTPEQRQTATPDENNTLPNVTSTAATPIFVTPREESSIPLSESGIVLPVGNITFPLPSVNGSTSFFSEGLNRQRRHTEFNGTTYYCYKIQKRYNHIFGTKRGCMSGKSELSVCDELRTTYKNHTKDCATCTTNRCNGSSTIGVSIATLLIVLFAVIFKA